MKRASIVFAACMLTGTAVLLASASSRAAGGNSESGKALYEESCAKCHGKTGDGDGRAGRSLDHKPTHFNEKAKLSADEKLFKATREGGKAVGQSADMEGFPKLTDDQVHDLIAYIKTLAK